MKIQGRHPKLTRQQVEELRAWDRARRQIPSRTEILRKYGISNMTLSSALGEGFKHYARPEVPTP